MSREFGILGGGVVTKDKGARAEILSEQKDASDASDVGVNQSKNPEVDVVGGNPSIPTIVNYLDDFCMV
ncbi:hypothetical protein V6N13_122530 [Hibiscus sabdariffa]|uniref:Uncharacterized protein n=1 Tax=Hibiscus sabdariffa TaxID=183260 RepID=A0ABR2Q715_9ROSI